MILSFLWVAIGCVDPIQCNGHEHLCDLPLNQVAFAGTHNAMSSSEDDWMFPNQEFAFERQLNDGIRGLNFDTYWWNDEPSLCHSMCELGSMPLEEGLRRIADFLHIHSNEVLLLTIQSNVDADATLNSFQQSGLLDQLFNYESGSVWPTLRELIEQDRRVVLFTDQGGGEHPGYLNQWEHWIDNRYSAQSIDDFSCIEERGDSDTATLFNVNHFITNPIANIDDSRLANSYDLVHEHATRCWHETGRFPNQILVDFYSQGDVIQVVNDLNILE